MRKRTSPSELSLPSNVRKLCGFDKQALEFHTAEDALVILKEKMTAIELVHAITALDELLLGLVTCLAGACTLCNNCGTPCKDKNSTPADWATNCSLCHGLLDDEQTICLPDALLAEAGIPKDAKLEAYPDPDNGEVLVAVSGFRNDISDVPKDLLELLIQWGVCLPELDELIVLEETVYGK